MSRDELEATKVSDRSSGSTTAAQSPQPVSFEEGLARLADLVGGLEGGRLGLAESIAAYEQGVSLVRRLHAELAGRPARFGTAGPDGWAAEGPCQTVDRPAAAGRGWPSAEASGDGR